MQISFKLPSVRRECSTGTVPSHGDTALTRWHRANTTDRFGLCEQDCQAWTGLCVSAEGSGIYRAEHICMASDKTLWIVSCCPQDSLVFTNNRATDSVIITEHILPCCYHHYTETSPMWHWDVTVHPFSPWVEMSEQRYPKNFPSHRQSSYYISWHFNTVQTARGIFKYSSMQISIKEWQKATAYKSLILFTWHKYARKLFRTPSPYGTDINKPDKTWTTHREIFTNYW